MKLEDLSKDKLAKMLQKEVDSNRITQDISYYFTVVSIFLSLTLVSFSFGMTMSNYTNTLEAFKNGYFIFGIIFLMTSMIGIYMMCRINRKISKKIYEQQEHKDIDKLRKAYESYRDEILVENGMISVNRILNNNKFITFMYLGTGISLYLLTFFIGMITRMPLYKYIIFNGFLLMASSVYFFYGILNLKKLKNKKEA